MFKLLKKLFSTQEPTPVSKEVKDKIVADLLTGLFDGVTDGARAAMTMR